MILTYDNNYNWNDIIKSFKNWDVYYLYEYCKSFELHGDGQPLLIYYEGNDLRLCYVVLKSDISQSKEFSGLLPENTYYDISTPYGYGGPLIEGHFSDRNIDDFFNELNKYCIEANIVSQFIRFNPIAENYKYFENVSSIKKNKQTVCINTSSIELIFENLTSKNRNMIRKAQKNNVQISSDNGENIDSFIYVYNETMKRNGASEYYYFNDEYFKYICNNMTNNLKIFYAKYNDSIISSSIILYNEDSMHYHLSGTLSEYMTLAANNFLLYNAAIWGCEKGITQFHLGGGVDSEDSLFSFKKSFNKHGLIDFYIGSNIFDVTKFDYLVELRKNNDNKFDENNKFLIKYRG